MDRVSLNAEPCRHPVRKPSPIRFAVTDTALLTLVLLALNACGQPPSRTPDDPDPKRAATTGESAYRRPPSLLRVNSDSAGRLHLEGLADPKARVRLASPQGQALFATPDAGGVWRLILPPLNRLRLFGLSMSEGPQSVQAEGYLAIAPGLAAQLRAGAGALVLTPSPAGLAISALDFDRKGAAVVSGDAPAGAKIALAIDAKAAGEAVADPKGHFAFDLGEPLSPGAHVIQVGQGAVTAQVVADASPGEPPRNGPFDAQGVGSGWRIVWMPPGGGLQTTILFGAAGRAR